MKKIYLFLFVLTALFELDAFCQPTDYIASYPFSGNALDASANAKNATVFNAELIKDRLDNENSAYLFNGSNSRIELPMGILTNSSAFTISLWFQSKGTNSSPDVYNTQYLLDLRGQYYIYIGYNESTSLSNPNSIFFATYTSAGEKRIYSSNNSIQVNTWYHVVAAFENRTMSLYLNGALIGTLAAEIPSATPAWSNCGNNIGKDYSSGENRLWFNGIIDDLNIYERGISSAEIQSLYNQSSDESAEWQVINSNLVSLNGNVGIGTPSPENKLDVNGTIRAKEIKVETGWADFVFLPSYKLKPLIEVEKYIKTNGHLEDIPSAEQVEKEGIKVGEMQAKLLQKIEELTLYTIEQNKKLEKQNKVNALLLQKIELLENQINNIKKP